VASLVHRRTREVRAADGISFEIAPGEVVGFLGPNGAGLTFLVPVAFAVTVPAEALTGRLTSWTLPGALALTVFLLVISRLIWMRGLRSYTGASA